MSDRGWRAQQGKHSLDAEDVGPFSSVGRYQTVYDLILELPFYRHAMDLHMQWIRSIAVSAPVVIDAGGGSGLMTAEARRVRRDADVYLFDVNPAMAEQARKRGVPSNRIVLADITDMSLDRSVVSEQQLEALFAEGTADPDRVRVTSQSVDHVFSHSVIWALPRPEAFFAESRRVLTPGGMLGLSTVGENLQPYRQYFLEYLDSHLSAAVQRGTVSPEQKTTFLEQNARITEVAASPLSLIQLRELGQTHGLAVEVAADCYVVDTPEGPRPYFHQVLYRKR